MNMERNSLDLRESIGVIWRNRVLIGVFVGVFTVGALAVSASHEKIYDASSYLVVRPALAPASLSSGSSRDAGALGRDVSIQSAARIAASALVGERVRARHSLQETAAQLSSSVNVSVLTDEILRVTARATTPERARDLANAFATEYLGYEREAVFQTLTDLAKDVQSRLNSMEKRAIELDKRYIELSVAAHSLTGSRAGGSANADIERIRVERNELLTRIGQMRARHEDLHATLTGSPGGGEILSEAQLPSKASRPVPMRDGAIGFMLGLMIGIAVAFVRHYVDDRIRSAHDVVSATGVSVMGAIPRARRWRRRREAYVALLGEPGSPAAEAYRSLRQTLNAEGVGRGLKTVLVTSGSRGAGKSSTAANLGVAFAQAGHRVLLLSADLRHPRLHHFFGMTNDVGFSEVLQGQKSLNDAILATAIPNLSVVPSGAVPRNPAALLDGPRLSGTIASLQGVTDVLIIDGPSIASGADAYVLAPYADVSLLTLRREFARAGGATAAVGGLKQAGASRLGAVLALANESVDTWAFDPAMSVGPEPHFVAVESRGSQSSNGHGSLTTVAAGPVAVASNGKHTESAKSRTTTRRRPTK